MRFYLQFILHILFFYGCKQQVSVINHVIIPRDTTITKQNAYSDLFMDSTDVEKFISGELKNDSMGRLFRNFYNSRNYEYAWFDHDGLTLQAEGFWNALDNYLQFSNEASDPDNNLKIILDSLLYEDSVYIQPVLLMQTELRLTKHFFDYAKAVYGTRTDPETFQWHIPKRKINIYEMLDSMTSKTNLAWQPLNRPFTRLQNAVLKYRNIEKEGGWGEIKTTKIKFKKGDSDSIIRQVKYRLAVTELYPLSDSSLLYSDSLEKTIRKAQGLYGLRETGVIDLALIKVLNMPVGERIRQMLLNLERIKWMPPQADKCIVVNIPEFRLHIFENKKELMRINVVVGKAAHKTVVFSDEIKYIVFSPYWNIPRSIVRNEIQPAMRRNKNYLRRHNMEITGYSSGLPVIRQKPGKSNALGKVKFLFPNSYNIYLHDTPAKSLFGRNERAFSHGCIRVEKPFELARYLLGNDSTWSIQKIKRAMNQQKEKWVSITNPFPVYITYFTSWVDPEGNVHFREDIYKHDEKLARQLFK